MIWHKETDINNVDFIIIPGGFSFGDYLRSGALAAKSPILESIITQSLKGIPILGVCNGFQILLETNLLPGALIRNENMKFVCKTVDLVIDKNINSIYSNSFLKNKVLKIPVAHNEGNYFISNEQLKSIKDNNQVFMRYYKNNNNNNYNPNGSLEDIAGIISKDGRMLGMMPHPERAMGDGHTSSDGLLFFKGVFEELSKC